MKETQEVLDTSHFDVSTSVSATKRITYGGHSDIWQGMMVKEGGDILVAIKQLRIRHRPGPLSHYERLLKHFNREVHAWNRLSHPNIVPFLGYIVMGDSIPSLISPWYSNGNVVDYLLLNPEIPRLPLLLQVAKGLEYLHSLPLVHGDIKGDNVLVDSDGRASLCDFGLSQFLDSALHIPGFTTTAFGGTSRFLSSELLDNHRKTKMSDIWAFACTAIQIMADQIPYQSTKDCAVQIAIVRGEPPLPFDYRPPTTSEANLWNKFRTCWREDPGSRPSISDIRYHIEESLAKRDFRVITLADAREPVKLRAKSPVTLPFNTAACEKVLHVIDYDPRLDPVGQPGLINPESPISSQPTTPWSQVMAQSQKSEDGRLEGNGPTPLRPYGLKATNLLLSQTINPTRARYHPYAAGVARRSPENGITSILTQSNPVLQTSQQPDIPSSPGQSQKFRLSNHTEDVASASHISGSQVGDFNELRPTLSARLLQPKHPFSSLWDIGYKTHGSEW